jgi:hypothetical protein
MNIKKGCYLMSFTPDPTGSSYQPRACIGTLRVSGNSRETPLRASGDLYSLSSTLKTNVSTSAEEDPDPTARAMAASQLGLLPDPSLISISDYWRARAVSPPIPIPHFPMEAYRYYLEVQSIQEVGPGLVLEITAHEYDPVGKTLKERGTMQVSFKPTSDGKALQGDLMDGDERRGVFYVQWINDNLRRAELRLFAIPPNDVKLPGRDVEAMTAGLAKAREERVPSSSRTGSDAADRTRVPGWEELFKTIGWDLTVHEDADASVKLDAWTAYDLSEAGQRLRQGVDPNGWTYDLLCVSTFQSSEYLGIMFDAEATDLNERPRESAAVAALQRLGVEENKVPFQDLLGGAAYYRTALHEIGHTMNLAHNLQGKSIMNTTGLLLQLATPAKQDQQAVPLRFEPDWKFSPDDAEWLQHAPDIAVRPGGISRRGVRLRRETKSAPAPLSLQAASDMVLVVEPVREVFPFGAPIRLDYTLCNHGRTMDVPNDISLRGGYVMGRVTGPDRVRRFFRCLFRSCDMAVTDGRLEKLESGQQREGGMTLLRGIDGPLFPKAGAYEIELEMRWDAKDQTHRVVGQTFVTVAAADPNDPAQAIAAAMILNDSSMMPALVQGLIDQKGLRALSVALRSSTLAEHYLSTALKCKIMGTKRGTNWDDDAKLGGKAAPVIIRPLPGDPTASSRDRFNISSRQIVQTGGSDANREIVQTRREQEQLGKEVTSPHNAPNIGCELEKVNRSNVVLSEASNEWLHRVHDFTLPREGWPTFKT